MGRGEAASAGDSDFGSLRTRSHSRGDPVWTVQDTLILVNEIAAVEGDCQNALSSYQKWGIIAENCTGLGVVRNLNQCRRKWESLVAEYKLVNEWEEYSRGDSYWSLGCERRKAAGIPVHFDIELYRAINGFMKTQDQANSDPEIDSDVAEIEVIDVTESGPMPKKVRRRSIFNRGIMKGRKRPGSAGEEMEQILAANLKQNTEQIASPNPKRRHWSRHQIDITKEGQQPVSEGHDHEKLGPGILGVKLEENMELIHDPKVKKETQWSSTLQNGFIEGRKQLLSVEEPKQTDHVKPVEQILVENIKENTELIHAILAGNFSHNLDPELTDFKDQETLKTEMLRCEAEKLISCLGDLTRNMDQLCNVVEKGQDTCP